MWNGLPKCHLRHQLPVFSNSSLSPQLPFHLSRRWRRKPRFTWRGAGIPIEGLVGQTGKWRVAPMGSVGRTQSRPPVPHAVPTASNLILGRGPRTLLPFSFDSFLLCQIPKSGFGCTPPTPNLDSWPTHVAMNRP